MYAMDSSCILLFPSLDRLLAFTTLTEQSLTHFNSNLIPTSYKLSAVKVKKKRHSGIGIYKISAICFSYTPIIRRDVKEPKEQRYNTQYATTAWQ
jgi:hypothetical protein